MFVFDDDLDGVNNLVTPEPVLLRAAVHHRDGRLHARGHPAERRRSISRTRRARASRRDQRAELGVEHRHVTSIVLQAHPQPSALQVRADKDELKCEAGTSKSLAKFVKAKGTCIQKCLDKAAQDRRPVRRRAGRRTAAPPPRCIQDAKKGAEAKARDAIAKACEKACPRATTRAATVPTAPASWPDWRTTSTTPAPLVYCLEAGGTTPTKAQAKCEDGVAKSLIKFTASKGKCYDKCVDKEFKGKIPVRQLHDGQPVGCRHAAVHREGRGQGRREPSTRCARCRPPSRRATAAARLGSGAGSRRSRISSTRRRRSSTAAPARRPPPAPRRRRRRPPRHDDHDVDIDHHDHALWLAEPRVPDPVARSAGLIRDPRARHRRRGRRRRRSGDERRSHAYGEAGLPHPVRSGPARHRCVRPPALANAGTPKVTALRPASVPFASRS